MITADRVREVRTKKVLDGDEVVSQQAVTTRSADASVAKGQGIVYMLFGLLQTMLGLRVVLSLMGANPANSFANFIYTVTNPFVSPFRGLFGYKLQTGVSRLEIETLVSMVVYALVAWFIINMVEIGKKNPEV